MIAGANKVTQAYRMHRALDRRTGSILTGRRLSLPEKPVGAIRERRTCGGSSTNDNAR
jgi:hypothetical protein